MGKYSVRLTRGRRMNRRKLPSGSAYTFFMNDNVGKWSFFESEASEQRPNAALDRKHFLENPEDYEVRDGWVSNKRFSEEMRDVLAEEVEVLHNKVSTATKKKKFKRSE